MASNSLLLCSINTYFNSECVQNSANKLYIHESKETVLHIQKYNQGRYIFSNIWFRSCPLFGVQFSLEFTSIKILIKYQSHLPKSTLLLLDQFDIVYRYVCEYFQPVGKKSRGSWNSNVHHLLSFLFQIHFG